MKTIIAGSRTISDSWEVQDEVICIHERCPITEVVCGGAIGPDTIGKCWAEFNNIPVKHFPADWKTHGKAAGPIRNKQMAEYADTCIVFWDGKSKGSKNMIQEALKQNLKLFVFTYEVHL
jgi:hypothetical protein